VVVVAMPALALGVAAVTGTLHAPAAGWGMAAKSGAVSSAPRSTPFFRYLMGDLLASTGGSLLATGIAHSSFNAANELGLVGNWQALPALAVLVGALAVLVGALAGVRRLRAR
jgi:hypothetical protein